MVLNTKERVSIATFEEFIIEQSDKDYELIGGEIVEVVSHSYSSYIAARLLIKIGIFVETNQAGYVTGADGGYIVGDERYLPDVGFVSHDKLAQAPNETYISVAPDLAVEVKSPTDREMLMTIKVSNYLAAGTVVWLVYPDEREIHVHRTGKSVRIYTAEMTLISEDVLSGFILKLGDIFAEQNES